ncbi:hypothetical protein GQ607_004790 [Colletotrichum asianum]|uniref:Uncharacterized protein n=1 Tax=Colletotrichum asianum TaxID=702518 RepID=A0A8H3WIX1_9PEZI|nr:hypothetical protein GQ607_004790 [Colletotrichum asianum]
MGFASACQHKLHQQDKIPRCSRRSRCWDRWRLLALQGYRARCLPAHHFSISMAYRWLNDMHRRSVKIQFSILQTIKSSTTSILESL